MPQYTRVLGCLLIAFASHWGAARADDADGFVALFNGDTLAGWVRVNTPQSTWRVEDGRLVCSGKPIGEWRTTRMYQNFIMEV